MKAHVTDFLRSRNQDHVPGAALPAHHSAGHLVSTGCGVRMQCAMGHDPTT